MLVPCDLPINNAAFGCTAHKDDSSQLNITDEFDPNWFDKPCIRQCIDIDYPNVKTNYLHKCNDTTYILIQYVCDGRKDC